MIVVAVIIVGFVVLALVYEAGKSDDRAHEIRRYMHQCWHLEAELKKKDEEIDLLRQMAYGDDGK